MHLDMAKSLASDAGMSSDSGADGS
jgi:hypothetical protein